MAYLLVSEDPPLLCRVTMRPASQRSAIRELHVPVGMNGRNTVRRAYCAMTLEGYHGHVTNNGETAVKNVSVCENSDIFESELS